jgi:hypothetical protein
MPNLFDSSSAAIGSVQASLLTEAEFQSIFGTGWVLARGQSVSGSKYASITGVTTVPDMRGMFLRGKNNGRSDGNQDSGGERNLRNGNIQQDQMQGHIHGTNIYDDNVGGTGRSFGQMQFDNRNEISTSFPRNDGTNGTPRTGTETRPRNITVNYFIRIN